MKQLFIISTVLLFLSCYAFAQDDSDTQTTIESQETVLERKDGGWFALSAGFQSIDLHLGYQIPDTGMDIRILGNYLFEGDFNIQTELLSFLPTSNRFSIYSGIGAAYHSEKGLGLASSSGFDIAIDDRSGILIDTGVNLHFNETDANIFSSPLVSHYSIGYRYSF